MGNLCSAILPWPRKRVKEIVLDRFSLLPEEIQHDILARLPTKSVRRCRAVFRSWRRLVFDPVFLLYHHQRQPKLPLIRSHRIIDGVEDLIPDIQVVHLRGGELRTIIALGWLIFELKLLGSRFKIHASCDGLLIIDNYICNPATHQWAHLLSNTEVCHCVVIHPIGLYRHQPSGEYRVLYWRLSKLPSDLHYTIDYCILTLGSNKLRHIAGSLAPVEGEEYLVSEIGPCILGAPVLIHGSLHMLWKPLFVPSSHMILVFDMVMESFRHMRPPTMNPQDVMHLFDIGGKLSVSTTTSMDVMPGISIFTLQDHQHDIWAFQYLIKLPVMDIWTFNEQGDWWANVVSEDGDVLAGCYGHLLHYDKMGKLVSKFEYDDYLPELLPLNFKESLIQHSFFPKDEQVIPIDLSSRVM